jgi:hypothetical protein
MKQYIFAGTLIAMLTACSTPQIKNQVEIIGDDMGDVKITDLRSMKVNDLLFAEGKFTNNGSKAAQGYYRCKFLDANKFQVGEDQTWQLVTIYPNQTQGFKCKANNLEATDFKIEFSNNANNVTIYK